MNNFIHTLGKYLLVGAFLFWATLFNLEDVSSLTPEAQAAPVVISDITFNSASWTVHERSEFGTSQTNSQNLSGGNPGAFREMHHILPPPANSGELAIIEVIHVYSDVSYDPETQGAIDHIDYFEDMVLLSLPWDEATIYSMVVLEQNGKLYHSSGFSQLTAQTNWTNRSLLNLRASNFEAYDDSASIPDFTTSGSPIKFGYYRLNSRFRDSPVPGSDILNIDHGIDNWKVEIYNNPTNRAPVARDDEFVTHTDFGPTGDISLAPLENDYDPDGDDIYIHSVGSPTSGSVRIEFGGINLEYTTHRLYEDTFSYTISDGELTASAEISIIHCTCFFRNLFQPEICNPPNDKTVAVTAQDTAIIDLFLQVRDGVMQLTEDGRRYVDIFYDNTFEITKILTVDRPDLRDSAITTITMLKEPLQNLVEGDGSAIISQALIDNLESFLLNLSAAGSAQLQQTISEEMSRLGPLGNYVGQTVKQATRKTIGVASKFPWSIFLPATITNPEGEN